MSTVSEVLAAVHAGLEVLAVSLVTNRCEDQPDMGQLSLVTVTRLATGRCPVYLCILSTLIDSEYLSVVLHNRET